MRGAEGPAAHQPGPFVQDPAHGVNLGGLNGLGKTQGRQNGGNAFGQHRLARTRRSNHEDVVAAGSGYFQGALGMELTFHVSEIHGVTGRFI